MSLSHHPASLVLFLMLKPKQELVSAWRPLYVKSDSLHWEVKFTRHYQKLLTLGLRTLQAFVSSCLGEWPVLHSLSSPQLPPQTQTTKGPHLQ